MSMSDAAVIKERLAQKPSDLEVADEGGVSSLSQRLLSRTQDRGMLKHPFYQAWERGELSLETLKTYARQYYQHVKAFPRYISATHSLCTELTQRQVLLENLNDEELGEGHHPGKWLQFATGLGQSADVVEAETAFAETEDLVRSFLSVARSSYAAGLAALFIYEQQIPAVARTKAEGLKRWYGINDDQTLDYFTLHAEVDVAHSEATRRLVDQLLASEGADAVRGADVATEALWRFLDRMYAVHQSAGPSSN